MKELKKKYSDADMSEVFGKESDEYDILRIVSEERKRVVKYFVVDCVNNVIKNLLHDIIPLYIWLFLSHVISPCYTCNLFYLVLNSPRIDCIMLKVKNLPSLEFPL